MGYVFPTRLLVCVTLIGLLAANVNAQNSTGASSQPAPGAPSGAPSPGSPVTPTSPVVPAPPPPAPPSTPAPKVPPGSPTTTIPPTVPLPSEPVYPGETNEQKLERAMQRAKDLRHRDDVERQRKAEEMELRAPIDKRAKPNAR